MGGGGEGVIGRTKGRRGSQRMCWIQHVTSCRRYGKTPCGTGGDGIIGALQRKQIHKIRYYHGSGWVGPGVTRFFFFFLENRPKNRPKPVLLFVIIVYFGVVYNHVVQSWESQRCPIAFVYPKR